MSKNILVVDDLKPNVYFLESLLKSKGYNVVVAVNGKDALKKLQENKIILIISDILMPVMDGFQFCKICKSDDELKKIPFIFYTSSYTEIEDEKLALDVGADKFVCKPIEPSDFIVIVDKLIEDFKGGKLQLREQSVLDEKIVLKEYAERLVNKLEHKMIDLENEIKNRIQAEQAMMASEELFRSTFEQAAVGMAQLLPDGRFVKVNTKLCDFLGYTKDEMLLKNYMEISAPEDLEQYHVNIKQLLESKVKTFTKDIRYIHKTGSLIWANNTVSLVRDISGVPKYFIAVIKDVIERKQAEEKLKTLSSIVEQSTEGIALADMESKIIFANNSWCEMHKYKNNKMILGKNLAVFHNKEQLKNDVIPFNERVNKYGTNSGEVGHITKDGKPFPTLMTTTLLKDATGNPYGIAGIAKDITEQKQVDEKLKKYQDHLEELVKDRTKELEKKNKELERFNKLFVGRELRIKELKDKIKEFEKS